MTVFLVGTDSVHTSAALCDYLAGRVGADDTVHAVNSLPGGGDTSSDDARDGEDALNGVAARLGVDATVETHQFVRGDDPATDLLRAADEFAADEIVVGVRRRDPTAKAAFGATARKVLLDADRPVVAVPLTTV